MSVFTAPEQMCQPKSMNFVRKMYVGTRIPSVEPHGLARGFSQPRAPSIIFCMTNYMTIGGTTYEKEIQEKNKK